MKHELIGTQWRSKHTGNLYEVLDVEFVGSKREIVKLLNKSQGGSDYRTRSTLEMDCEKVTP